MFSLMGNCITWVKGNNERKDITLLAVGLDNAGKTTTVHGVKGVPNTDVAPTMGFSSIDLRSGNYNINIFDLGGGAKIRGIWHNYMAEAHGIIFVVDSSDLERMEECRETFDKLVSDSRLQGKPVLILANKQDQPQAMDELDLCNRLNIDEVVNRNESFSKVILCSALPVRGNKKLKKPKLDRGIKTGFVWLLDIIGRDYDLLQERVLKDKAEQDKRDAEERLLRNERVARIREERERLENLGDVDETTSTSERPRPEGISHQELPNDTSTDFTEQNEPQIILEPPVSGLGGNLLDDESDNDDVITVVHHRKDPTTQPANLPGAIVTHSTVFSEEIKNPNNQHSSKQEGENITNPRSLSAVSLREIIRDTPTPVSINIETPREMEPRHEGTRVSTPVQVLKPTINVIEGSNEIGSVDSPRVEKKKKKKKRRKKNKIDPGSDEVGSELSYQSGPIPGKLTPLKILPGLSNHGLDKLPPIKNAPNFDSEVEV